MDRRDFVKTLAGTAVAVVAGDTLAASQASVPIPLAPVPIPLAPVIPTELLDVIKLKGDLYFRWNKIWNSSESDSDVDIEQPKTWLPVFDIATLYENQRLLNENSLDTGDSAQFKRVSLPLVWRIFNIHYVGHHLVNFTAMLRPRQVTWWHGDRDGFVSNAELIQAHSALDSVRSSYECDLGQTHQRWHLDAKTEKYDIRWYYEAQRDFRANSDMASELEMCSTVLASNMAFDLNHKIVDKIANAVLGGRNYIHSSHVGMALGKAVQAVQASCGHEANWAVMGVDAVAEFCDAPIKDYLSVRKVADFKGVHIYLDSKLPSNRIVAGYKPRTGRMEDAFGGGMVHGVYVPCSPTPVALDPKTLRLSKGILIMHDFKFREDGGLGYYAVADVK